MSAAAAKTSSFRLSADEADALGWADLADPAPSVRAPLVDPVLDPLFLGAVKARQRGVKGEVSLDVLLDAAGAWVEVGPLRFKRSDVAALKNLFIIADYLIRHPQPVSQPLSPPWEGETRP